MKEIKTTRATINNAELARRFCKAVETLGKDEERLENLQFYLERFFNTWWDKWANSPEGLTAELEHFAEIEMF